MFCTTLTRLINGEEEMELLPGSVNHMRRWYVSGMRSGEGF